MISGNVYGTVFSGHPTRTTFGNTMRVIYYALYTKHLASIEKMRILVAGDDVLLEMEETDYARFYQAHSQVYWLGAEGYKQHGLGQLSKGTHKTGRTGNFLSKKIYNLGYDAVITRTPLRIIATGLIYDPTSPIDYYEHQTLTLANVREDTENNELLSWIYEHRLKYATFKIMCKKQIDELMHYVRPNDVAVRPTAQKEVKVNELWHLLSQREREAYHNRFDLPTYIQILQGTDVLYDDELH